MRDGGVAVLLEAADDAQAEQRAGELLTETGAGAAASAALRRDPADLPRSYDEALYAIDARPPNGAAVSLATFRDLGSMQLLLSLQDDRGVELYCDSLLGRLVDHDERHGSALVESLRAYIEANGRWAEAAAGAVRAPPHAALPGAQDRGADGARPDRCRRPARAVAGAARAPAALPGAGDGDGLSTVAVVGAAGIIGPAIVATLAEQEAVERIRASTATATARGRWPRRTAAARRGRRARHHRPRRGGGAGGATLLLNTAAYRINLAAMEAALAAGAHYIDLGGLYHVTREQLHLDSRFREAGLLAVLGMGSTPGKTNVMAAHAVDPPGRADRPDRGGGCGARPEPAGGAAGGALRRRDDPGRAVDADAGGAGGEHVFLDPLTDAGSVEFGPRSARRRRSTRSTPSRPRSRRASAPATSASSCR